MDETKKQDPLPPPKTANELLTVIGQFFRPDGGATITERREAWAVLTMLRGPDLTVSKSEGLGFSEMDLKDAITLRVRHAFLSEQAQREVGCYPTFMPTQDETDAVMTALSKANTDDPTYRFGHFWEHAQRALRALAFLENRRRS